MDSENNCEALFAECASLVERTVEGYSAAVMCYGITGAGKSQTMYGSSDPSSQGLLQRTAARVFDCVDEKSKSGDVFIVEASYFQVHSAVDGQEQLVDLLTSDNTMRLELRQDPFVPGSWTCDGLRKEAVRTAEEVVEHVARGRKRHADLEAAKQCDSAKVHTLLLLSIECLSMTNAETQVQRGKLILADLAGSEATADTGLMALGTAMSTGNTGQMKGHKDSQLTQLLCDCIGGSPRSGCVLITNIDDELSNVAETMKSLKFARQFVSSRTVAAGSAAPVGAVADLPHIRSLSNPSAKAGVGNLQNMKDKNREVIRMLQEKVMDQSMNEQEERTRMSHEISQISAMMTAKEAKDERTKTIEEVKNEMQQTMAAEFEKWRTQSMQEQADKMAALEAEVERLQVKAKEADDEAVDLRIKLASSEERVKHVNHRIEELQGDRHKVEDERKSMRSEKDQQWERLNTAERELFKAKADAEVQRGEVERLMKAKAEDEDAFRA